MCSFTFNFSAGEPSTLIEKPIFIPLQPGTLRLAGLKKLFILVFFFGIGVELKGHLPAEDGDGRLETLLDDMGIARWGAGGSIDACPDVLEHFFPTSKWSKTDKQRRVQKSAPRCLFHKWGVNAHIRKQKRLPLVLHAFTLIHQHRYN